MPALKHRALIAFLGLLPKNLMSRAAGALVSIPLPGFLRPVAMKSYAWAFGADLSEVRDPLSSFRSVQDFFIRHLKPDCRPVASGADALVSPCDGAWGQWGTVQDGMLLQIKGRPYSLAELLGDGRDAQSFEGGVYATLYLSPKDYHRFHTPCAARLKSVRYLPGSLWPVNAAGVECVDGLFARNERICAFMEAAEPGFQGRLCLVAVGATMVGKVKLAFDDLETNLSGAQRQERVYDPPISLGRCEEWGRFLFGSTLVLVAAPGAVELDGQPMGTALRLGRRIGRMTAQSTVDGAEDSGKT